MSPSWPAVLMAGPDCSIHHSPCWLAPLTSCSSLPLVGAFTLGSLFDSARPGWVRIRILGACLCGRRVDDPSSHGVVSLFGQMELGCYLPHSRGLTHYPAPLPATLSRALPGNTPTPSDSSVTP